jgi:hypothetical protein
LIAKRRERTREPSLKKARGEGNFARSERNDKRTLKFRRVKNTQEKAARTGRDSGELLRTASVKELENFPLIGRPKATERANREINTIY